MQERQFGASPPTFEDGGVTNLQGFRPIVLYDTSLDMIDESLTLSRSRKDLQLPQFSTLSSRELDEIDAECSSRVSSQELQLIKSPSEHDPQQTQECSPPPRSRQRGFAAGDSMFNYRALGSLRSGLAPIALLSRWYAGLAVTAFASGASMTFMRAAYRPLLLTTLNESFNREYGADTALLDWPNMLAVFLGLFSDCMPIYGTRRKAYVALGWIFSAVSFTSVCVIFAEQVRDAKKPDAIFGRLLEAWSVIGSFALQLSWVAALAMVVGFGQREALSERGGLATFFLLFWQTGALTAHTAIAELQSKLTLLNSSAVVATASVTALPFILCFLHDDDELDSTTTLVASTKRVGVVPALRTGVIQLWEICQEKITYRVLLFLLFYCALLRVCDPNLYKVFAIWSGFVHPDNILAENPWLLVLESGVAVVALLHAKWRLLSTAWKQLAFVGTGVVVVGSLVQAILITTNVARNKWFFSISIGIIVWPKTWILLFLMLTTTEITHVGCEGVTMGLVLSGQGLATSTITSFSRWISQTTNTQLTHGTIDEDSHSTRTRILIAAVSYTAVNLFAAAAVPWLPRSKLEAQQLRAFGGYSRKGAALVVVLLVLLLSLAIVINLPNM
ncbi:unnamed protein product [Phytophthora lilii]|uniref:Unnamed protein product n=1 Tax=Phytophthora lilii TaxID=2077276 RepID=A0A9W6WT73_9STRA|nr:unnamed protein product [Phytophthora lilii]